MSKFSDLPANTTPTNDDIIAIEQDADGLNRKTKLSELPIIGELASTANGEGASKVGVEDAGGNFTATTVEGVLSELFAMLDGLDPWVSATTYTAGQDAVILTSNNRIYRCIVTNSDVTFTPANWQVVGKDAYTIADDTATGSNQTLTAPTTELIRLTDASLVSIDMIPAGETGNPIWLINDTGNSITINDQTGATASQKIKTGTGAPLAMEDQSSIQVIYDTTDSRWQIVGGTGSGTGGSGSSGSLDVFYTFNNETLVAADFSKGNSVTFLSGGSLVGTLTDETASPISALSSLKYTSAAVSINDWIASPVIDLDPKQRGQDVGINFWYTQSGVASGYEFVIWDVTNSAKLNSILDETEETSNNTRFSTSVFIPLTCTQIRWGIHAITEQGIGPVLVIDDLEKTLDPFSYQDIIETQDYRINQDGSSLTNRGGEIEFNLGTATIVNNGEPIIIASDDSGNTRTKFTAQKKANVTISFSASIADAGKNTGVAVNGIGVQFGSADSASANQLSTVVVRLILNEGDYVTVGAFSELIIGADSVRNAAIETGLIIHAEATSPHVVTRAKSNMTDWENYTPTFTGFGAVSISAVKHKRSGDSLEIRGTFTGGSATGVEARISLPSDLVSDSNISTLEFAQGQLNNSATIGRYSASLIEPSVTYLTFSYQDNTTAGYFTKANGNAISAGGVHSFYAKVPIEGWSSDAQFLAAVPVQKVCYLEDQKTTNVAGGTFSSGTFQTRDLNTVLGDSEIVTLSSNQFILSAGKYAVEFSAPAYSGANNSIGEHVAKITNITDATNAIVGDSLRTERISSGGVYTSFCRGSGVIEITSTKTFELVHRCSATGTSHGFGYATNLGPYEVYSRVKITKLR